MVKHVLPTIRAMVAKELVENYDFTQVEAAKKLGISQAAVSWYVASKRGHADKKGYRVTYVEKSQEVRSLVCYLSKEIASKESITPEEINRKLCETCIALRSNSEFCRMHLSLSPSVKGCMMCLNNSK
ncbi:MAG: hypothetical protein QXJ75_06590 [Candidatus Bathyarchaeia archaeon]